MELVLGAGKNDRVVDEVEARLLAYREDSGAEYLDFEPCTPTDRLAPEDLAVTTLINSRFGMSAFRSLAKHSHLVDLRLLPDVALEESTDNQRERVTVLTARVASWPGFGASTATKVLHKKRPRLIPILDNQAIFGAYMNPLWPDRSSLTETVKSPTRIKEALDWIAFDLVRDENHETWTRLQEIEPKRSRIQLFDSVWWIYFRDIEPVQRASAVAEAPEAALAAIPSAAISYKGSKGLRANKTVIFIDDEDGYRAWIAEHSGGYVLNSYRRPKASYLKLHRAFCSRISGTPPRGATWTSPFMKVCAEDRSALEAWAAAEASGTVSPCAWCSA